MTASPPPSSATSQHDPWIIGIYSLAYALACRLSQELVCSESNVELIWLAGGVALAGLLHVPKQRWPLMLGCFWILNLSVKLVTGRAFLPSLGFACLDVAESLVCAGIIRQWCQSEVRFSRLMDVLALTLAATVVNGVTAFLAAWMAWLSQGSPFYLFLTTWWIGDSLSLLLITPLILSWVHSDPVFLAEMKRRWLPVLIFLLCWLMVVWVVFHPDSVSLPVHGHPYMIFALLVWVGLIAEQRLTSLALVLLATAAITSAVLGSPHFPFPSENTAERVLSVHVFIAVVSITGLALTASLMERKEMLHSIANTESRVRESETIFRTALMSSPIGMALVSPEGRWIDVNPVLCDLLGYTREELLVTDFQTLTHPDDLKPDLALLDQMLRHEIENYQMEKRYVHKDGGTIWAQLNVSLVWNEDGTPKHFISQIQDITRRKFAEEKLNRSMKSMADLKVALDEHAIVAIVDARGVVLDVNEKFSAFTSYGRSEMQGRHIEMIGSEVHSEAFLQELHATLTYGRVWEGELCVHARDGSPRWVRATVVPFMDFIGQPAQFIGICVEIDAPHDEPSLEA